MKYNSIHIIMTLICMFGTQVFGQSKSIKADTIVSQTRMNLEIEPTVILKKNVLNKNIPQSHTYYQTTKLQSVDKNVQMKIKVRKPKESLPLKTVSPINNPTMEKQRNTSTIIVKEIKLVKSPTINRQVNPAIKDKKDLAPITKPTMEKQKYPASRKINEK